MDNTKAVELNPREKNWPVPVSRYTSHTLPKSIIKNTSINTMIAMVVGRIWCNIGEEIQST